MSLRFPVSTTGETYKVVINWERYAELLGYDRGWEEIYRMGVS